VRSIYSIAAALEVPVDYFFPDQESSNSTIQESPTSAALTASEMREAQVGRGVAGAGLAPRVGSPAPVVHVKSRPTIELKGGVTWARLTAFAEPDAEFLEITYAPGASSGANLSHHEGREFGLVLEGEIVVELGFEHHTLRCGDSIIFDSTTPHRLSNRSSQPVRALWVVLNRTR
jgi:mannose-6-phosphate isomerase-like protein (cupin superfamily)